MAPRDRRPWSAAPRRSLPSAATLINGAASHALDYDDVNFAMGGHPTVTVVPALLALGEQTGRHPAGCSSKLRRRLRDLRPRRPPGRAQPLPEGFHVTGTVGSFSATAAAGRMLGLDAKQLAVAFGIAATQAAGLKSNFGTMCKPLHAGTASRARPARGPPRRPGLYRARRPLECDQGFAASQSTI